MHGMAQQARALRHPVFVGALALLVLNDHVLKHAGALPGWLTGKLSDLAGLIVAPVVLVVLLGLRGARGRAAAFALVAGVFALLELSPRAAAGWDAALGAFGVPSRSWPDPSDLLALAVLPIAWAIVRVGDRAAPARGLALGAQQALLGAALFACIATSRTPEPGPAQWTTDAWLRNRSAESLDVRIRWARGPLDCTLLAGRGVDLSAAASPDLFEDGITFRLAPGDTVPIEPVDAAAAAAGTFPRFGRPAASEARRPCELARVSVDGLDESVVFWAPRTEQLVLASQPELEGEGETEAAMELAIDEAVTREGALRLLPGSGYRVAPLRDRATPTSAGCEGARGATLAFGGSAFDGVRGTITSRALLPDGCTMLELTSETRTSEPFLESLVLCVPGDFVPFDVDDAIAVSIDAAAGRLSVRDEAPAPRELVVVSGGSEVRVRSTVATPGPASLGCAERVECGAYVAPVLAVTGPGFELGIDEVWEQLSGDHRERWLLARAEHVIVASAECDVGRDAAGARIDAAVLIEPLALAAPADEGEVP